MGLIKSTEAPAGVAAFSMLDIEAAARQLLLRARANAAEITAAAQRDAEQLRRQGHVDGLAEGKKAGFALGQEEGRKTAHTQALAEHQAALKKLVDALSAAAKQIELEREELRAAGTREVAELACAIARRVSLRQGGLSAQVLMDNLNDAMSLAVQAADVRIAVHPAQLKTLQQELPHLQLNWPQLKHVDLVEDASLAPGGTRIFTLHGQIDADLNAQLDQIIGELLPSAAGETALLS